MDIPEIFDATQLIFFLALAHISMLRNWCLSLHLHTSLMLRNWWDGVAPLDDNVSCTCTHLWCYATDVCLCTCTHLWCSATDGMGWHHWMITFLAHAHIFDATQLMFFSALAHISMLRNWCFFSAFAHISMLRNWCFSSFVMHLDVLTFSSFVRWRTTSLLNLPGNQKWRGRLVWQMQSFGQCCLSSSNGLQLYRPNWSFMWSGVPF